MKSNCCKAQMNTVEGDEGTNHWRCEKCGKPCDPAPILSREQVLRAAKLATEDQRKVMNQNTTEELAVDHKRAVLIRALKSIVPPPYMLQATDIEELHRKGYTSATALMENERREREYMATIDRLEKYVDSLASQIREEENAKNEKWANAHATFVADVLDGMKPEEAYRHLNKTLRQNQ